LPKNCNVEETAYVIGKSTRLTKEYYKIIEEYKQRGYVIDNIQKYDIKNETNLQKDTKYMLEIQGQMPI